MLRAVTHASRLSLALSLLFLVAGSGCDKTKKEDSEQDTPPPQTVAIGGDDALLADLALEVPATAGTATVTPMMDGKVMVAVTNLNLEIVAADEIDETFKNAASGREVRIDTDTADEFVLAYLPRSEGEAESYTYFVKKELDGQGYVCGARVVSDYLRGLA